MLYKKEQHALLFQIVSAADLHTVDVQGWSYLLSLLLQAIINCSVTPSMTFTKTSQKFGQWADSRANTVYGLGFATEQQLHQVKLKVNRGQITDEN